MSLLTLDKFRKKALSSTKYSYSSAILTTLDHFRSTHYSKLLFQDKTIPNVHLSHIRNYGYSIVNNYIKSDLCLAYIEEVDYILKKYPNFIHPNNDDQRIYGAENISEKILSFSSDIFLKQAASLYNQIETRTAFTLAAKLPYSKNNLGSGGGWHRDSCIKQFKAILYLSNVTEKNGPFQLISKSNNLKYKLLDSKKTNQPYMGYRFTEHQINTLIEQEPNRLINFCAPAGTLILVDTSCIHRGKPIEEGDRYALFNYYYPTNKINHDLLKQFSPIAQK